MADYSEKQMSKQKYNNILKKKTCYYIRLQSHVDKHIKHVLATQQEPASHEAQSKQSRRQIASCSVWHELSECNGTSCEAVSGSPQFNRDQCTRPTGETQCH